MWSSLTVRQIRVRPGWTPGGAEPSRVGAAIIKDPEKQMAQDIPIWENKAYWGRPILAEGDEGFNTYRKWYRQFFSEDYDARSKGLRMTRAIDTWVNVNMEELGRPDYLVAGCEPVLQAG